MGDRASISSRSLHDPVCDSTREARRHERLTIPQQPLAKAARRLRHPPLPWLSHTLRRSVEIRTRNRSARVSARVKNEDEWNGGRRVAAGSAGPGRAARLGVSGSHAGDAVRRLRHRATAAAG